jgi:hypothetical protein
LTNTSLPGIEVSATGHSQPFADRPRQSRYSVFLYMTKLLLDRSAIDAAKKGSADLFILALIE